MVRATRLSSPRAISGRQYDLKKIALDKLEQERRNRMEAGEQDLTTLAGILGYPSVRGYLWTLKDFIKNTPGVDSPLHSSQANVDWVTEVREMARNQIERYEAKRDELEKSPAAVVAYLVILEKNKSKWFKFNDRRAQTFITKTNEEITRYQDIHRRLAA